MTSYQRTLKKNTSFGFGNKAGVVELVDTRDLKSLSREGVLVQVQSPVPYFK